MKNEEENHFDWADAAEVFINHFPDEIAQQFYDFSASKDSKFELLVVERWFALARKSTFSNSIQLKDFVNEIYQNESEKWLQSRYKEVRIKAIENIFQMKRNIELDVEYQFNECLVEDDFPHWLHCIQHYYFKYEKNYLLTKKSREHLRKWAYRNYTLQNLFKLHDLFDNYIDYFIGEIQEFYISNLGEDDAEFFARKIMYMHKSKETMNCLNQLKEKFSNNDIISESLNHHLIYNLDLKTVKATLDIMDFKNERSRDIAFSTYLKLIDINLAIQILEKLKDGNHEGSIWATIKLLGIKEYSKRYDLIDDIFSCDDLKLKARALDYYLLNPKSFEIIPYINELLNHKESVIRFLAICSLVYLDEDLEVERLLQERYQDNCSAVRAAAIRTSAMLDGVNFVKAPYLITWNFYPTEKLSFLNHFPVLSFSHKDIDILDDNLGVHYGIIYQHLDVLLKKFYNVNLKELPKMHSLDLAINVKCNHSDDKHLPLWIKRGLEDKDLSIVLATIEYLWYYLTNLEDNINYEILLKLLESLCESTNEKIANYSRFIHFLLNLRKNETQTLIEFANTIEKKNEFEQRLFIWIIGIRKDELATTLLFDILSRLNERISKLIGFFSVVTHNRFLKYLNLIINNSDAIFGEGAFTKVKRNSKDTLIRVSGTPSKNTLLVDWWAIPHINLIWEYISSSITPLTNLPNRLNMISISLGEAGKSETESDVSKRWLQKLNIEKKKISKKEFRNIIESLISSDNLIASSFGLALSYHSGIAPRNLLTLSDNKTWLKNNIRYILEYLDKLPLNKTNIITKGIESNEPNLLHSAIHQISEDLQLDEILLTIMKAIITHDSFIKNKLPKEFRSIKADPFRFDVITRDLVGIWKSHSSNLFDFKSSNIRKTLECIDEIIDEGVDMSNPEWWNFLDQKIIFELLKWSQLKKSREGLYRLFHHYTFVNHYSRNWYKNPIVVMVC
ncbi:MAG: hypothetical protein HZR80_02230 [Candidatus Heimdallarchaeota archaeon]